MAKDRNGKQLDIGDEIIVVFRVEEIVPHDGDVAVIRARGVHGKSAKFPTPWEVVLYPDQVVLQRSAAKIKPRGCPVRGCGQPMPHVHPNFLPTRTDDNILSDTASG